MMLGKSAACRVDDAAWNGCQSAIETPFDQDDTFTSSRATAHVAGRLPVPRAISIGTS
jgi:hypothetical protein